DFLGAHGLVVAARRSAGLSPGAEKAAAGALESLGVARVVNLATAIEELKREGLWAIGAEADGQIPPWEVDLTGPLVLVLGGEDRGLGHAVRRACDVVVRIPRAGSVPSLNVAAAAAILLYEVSKQRASGRLSQGSAQPPRDGAQLFRGSARLPPQKPG
ncbi:MAG TPA: RNA methyltransferase, partial [Firmicutes bacterium]|nr:RNA methyltransferase [Bacillota bacterium]